MSANATIINLHSVIQSWARSKYWACGSKKQRNMMTKDESKHGCYIELNIDTSRLICEDKTLDVSVR